MIRCNCCRNCQFLFKDDSVGYSECTKTDLMTDAEFDQYERFGSIADCPHYKEDECYYVPITPSDVDLHDTLILAAQKGLKSNNPLKQLYADYIHEEESYQPWADDPGMDWPDENWPTLAEYTESNETIKNKENTK